MRKKNTLLLLAVHVDDMLVATSTTEQREWLVSELGKKVTLKVERQPKWLLHMRLDYNQEKRVLKIDQEAYLKDVLDKFDQKGRKQSRLPLQDCKYLTKAENSDLSADEIHWYQAVVGSLMYAATHTRPDLAFAVGHLGKFLHAPARQHLEAALRVLYYVRGTLGYKLVYTAADSKHSSSCVVDGWSDANFANEEDRHSTGAYLFCLNGNIISWQSRRQKTVSVSTVEAELTAASEAAREAKALRGILVQCGLMAAGDKIVLWVDNSPAVAAIGNPGYYGRLKHLDVQQKFVMEANKVGDINVKWCSTADMLADCLTKPSSGKQLAKFYYGVMNSAAKQ
jgi:hypothetical protein